MYIFNSIRTKRTRLSPAYGVFAKPIKSCSIFIYVSFSLCIDIVLVRKTIYLLMFKWAYLHRKHGHRGSVVVGLRIRGVYRAVNGRAGINCLFAFLNLHSVLNSNISIYTDVSSIRLPYKFKYQPGYLQKPYRDVWKPYSSTNSGIVGIPMYINW